MVVPTIVPKPRSPAVTQENLPGHESDALRSVTSPWVTLDREIRSLKMNGERWTELSAGDVWCDFPRVGVLIPNEP